MDLKKINEVLNDLDNIKLREVSNVTPNSYWNEKHQGETDQSEIVYDLEDGSGLFLKVTRSTDSYADNEKIISINFVKPTTKEVTVYE